MGLFVFPLLFHGARGVKLLEAIVAIDRPHSLWPERNLGFGSTGLTNNLRPLAGHSLPFSASPACWAPLGDVFQALFSIILLLFSAEKETPPTILTRKDKVLVAHCPLAGQVLQYNFPLATLQAGLKLVTIWLK